MRSAESEKTARQLFFVAKFLQRQKAAERQNAAAKRAIVTTKAVCILPRRQAAKFAAFIVTTPTICILPRMFTSCRGSFIVTTKAFASCRGGKMQKFTDSL